MAATVSNVTGVQSNGTFKIGDIIDIQVTFSEDITVAGGTPYITLVTNNGGSGNTTNVDYTSGGGSDAILVFQYTVASGDNSNDLDYENINSLVLNGATIKNTAGPNEDATLTLATPNAASSLSGNKNYLIDGISPTAAITYNSTGPYKNGETVTITATFTEDMADSPVPQIAIAGTAIASVSATNMTKSSATEYTYSYAVPTGDGNRSYYSF